MYIYQLDKDIDYRRSLYELGVERGGIEIISKKMDNYIFYIKELKTPAANILKQDCLSIGAELAVPRGTVVCQNKKVDSILVANRKQLEILSKKELSQPFGLKEFAKYLQDWLEAMPKYPVEIMGVVNANSDSFYEGSRFKGTKAIDAISKMIEDGATIIDIGGVSSRPGSIAVDSTEELSRVEPILEEIYKKSLYKEALFSIDSYTPVVIKRALDCGFGFINDITGATDENVISLANEYNAKLCIMHMKGTPQTMQLNPHYEDVIDEVDNFFADRISKCIDMGLSKDQIVLDVGIGFGKRLEDNLRLLKHHSTFLKHKCQLLIGASRKSMIDHIIPTPIDKRLPGTLAIHLSAIDRGATIIRCHDVAEHKQAIMVHQALKEII